MALDMPILDFSGRSLAILYGWQERAESRGHEVQLAVVTPPDDVVEGRGSRGGSVLERIPCT